MGPERRKQIILGVLGLALLVVVARGWWTSSDGAAPASKGTAGGTAAAGRQPSRAASVAAEVHLQALATEPPPLAGTQRNPFRFKVKPPPAPAASPGGQRGAAGSGAPSAPPPPAGPPPIALKFIGIVAVTGNAQRFAVLSDGRGGAPFSGREGDIIEGRYRILKIGSESIEMAYLDGRGRQTIRLSGS